MADKLSAEELEQLLIDRTAQYKILLAHLERMILALKEVQKTAEEALKTWIG